MLHNLVAWLCGEFNPSREWVNTESLYNLDVSTGYLLRHTVWWVASMAVTLTTLEKAANNMYIKIHSCHTAAPFEKA